MTKDQLSVFVHSGTGQTQEGRFARMPDADVPAPVQTNAAGPEIRS